MKPYTAVMLGAACMGALIGLARAQEASPPAYGNRAACNALVTLSGTALYDPTAIINAASFREETPAPPVPIGAPAGGRGAGGPPQGPLPQHCEIFGEMQRHNGPNNQVYAIKFQWDPLESTCRHASLSIL